MIIVVLTNYSDGPSDNLYTGDNWKDAVKAIFDSYATAYIVQQWENGKLIEEWKKS